MKIQYKIGSGFLFCALLFLVNFWIIKYIQGFENKAGESIKTITERNLTLNQKIAIECEWFFRGQETVRHELVQDMILFENSLKAIKEGGLAPGTKFLLPPAPEPVQSTIADVEGFWKKYKIPVLKLLDDTSKGNYSIIQSIESDYDEMISNNSNLVTAYSKFLTRETAEIVERQNFFLILFLIFNMIMAGGAIWLTQLLISKPITNLARTVDMVAEGDLSQSLKYDVKDEIGQASTSVNKLIINQKKASDFARAVGDGKFDGDFKPISQNDTLGISLVNMRDKLKAMAVEDQKRNWVNEGLAKFGEVLRMNSDNLEVLSHEIISNLVKYLKANQGALFIINDFNPNEISMELAACYAWERKKFINKKISVGDGLIGQAWQEGEYIFMTDVPDHFVHITSGLGEANPRCILIMPLKINEKIYGIVEVASFAIMEKHEIEFVSKLSESIASTISSTKINERTKRLLHESQQQAEELKAQEEEMRQNMEEMTATQEEMQRKEADLQRMLGHSKTQEEEMRRNLDAFSSQQKEMQKLISEKEKLETESMSMKQELEKYKQK